MTERVGVIGVGNMGAAMARRLLDGGYATAVRDIVSEREQALSALGASVCSSPAELAERSDIVIVAVVDAAQVHTVLTGVDGVLSSMSTRACVALCSTIAPSDVERAARSLGERGVQCIDAPMSGGPARARDGTMSLMIACADDLFARHRALLEWLSSRLVRVGSRIGDGMRTKLVNNLLAAINLAGAAEAMALASRLGLDSAATLDVIERSSGQSWIGSDRMRRALAGDFAPRAHTSLLRKDARLALDMAHAAGVQPELGATAATLFARACEGGWADLDDASLYEMLVGRER